MKFEFIVYHASLVQIMCCNMNGMLQNKSEMMCVLLVFAGNMSYIETSQVSQSINSYSDNNDVTL